MSTYVSKEIPGDIPEDLRSLARSSFVDITHTPFGKEVYDARKTLHVEDNYLKIFVGGEFLSNVRQISFTDETSLASVKGMPTEYILLMTPNNGNIYVGPREKIMNGIVVAAPAAAAAPVAAGGAGGGAAAPALVAIEPEDIPAGSDKRFEEVTATPVGIRLLEHARGGTIRIESGKPLKRTDGELGWLYEPYYKGIYPIQKVRISPPHMLLMDGGMTRFFIGPSTETFKHPKSRRALRRRTSRRVPQRRASRRNSNRR